MSHSSKDDDFVRALQQAKNVYEEFAEAVRRLGSPWRQEFSAQ
jgi:hypothetical protein